MVDIKRDTEDRNRFILMLENKTWSISMQEAQYLYRKMRVVKVWDDGTLKGEIAQKIIDFREASGMTQSDIAKKLGVCRMEIHRWEKGMCAVSRMATANLKAHGVI